MTIGAQMSSLDDAIHDADTRHLQQSKLEQILTKLNKEEAQKLVEVYLPDRQYSASQIARALTTLGYPCSRHVVQDWRDKHAPR